MSSRVLCEVFRSSRKEGMYLYVRREEGLARVPEHLLTIFGNPESVLVFLLEPGRKLARVSTPKVMDALESQGFFMQMPPSHPNEEQQRAD